MTTIDIFKNQSDIFGKVFLEDEKKPTKTPPIKEPVENLINTNQNTNALLIKFQKTQTAMLFLTAIIVIIMLSKN